MQITKDVRHDFLDNVKYILFYILWYRRIQQLNWLLDIDMKYQDLSVDYIKDNVKFWKSFWIYR
jgi:hypothetical protein